jgi:2-polyprenyl-6-methoxyphenol hydroxylase-like FAD-dependent oxidoreductase
MVAPPDRPASDKVSEPGRSLPVRTECDVLVVGGGPAGIAAAAAAARNGARTLLVERTGSLGGLATGGLIILLLTMDDGRGRQVIAGLCQEMIDRLDARGAAVFPLREEWGSPDPELIGRYQRWGLVWGHGPHVVRYSVAYDPEEFRFAANDLVLSSGARLLFHAWGARAIMEDDRIAAVAIESKSGREAIRPRIVIDATGDGDILASAGVPFESEKVLPWLWFRMAGVEDRDRAIEAGGDWFFKTPGEGHVLLLWARWGRSTGRSRRWTSRISPTPRSSAAGWMEEADRLRRVPGFEKAFVTGIASQLGITESRRMVGARVLRREEADRPLEDVVARTGNWTKYGTIYDIPYGSLVAQGVRNLLVAGRCISVDHRVHHSTKEIPACFATGEAAGTAAALALRAGVAPRDLDVAGLQERLKTQGASLGI